MIVIADSGSSKTDWRFIDDDDNFTKLKTKGLNILQITPEEFTATVKEIFKDIDIRSVSEVHFYSAGVGTTANKTAVKSLIKAVCKNAKIKIETDLTGTAIALCREQKGVIGIIGTGCHAGFFDGKALTKTAMSLGYVLGDEGSGAWFGKQILRDYFYDKMPAELYKNFTTTYKPTIAKVLEATYREPYPARYLANFTMFLSANRKHAYAQEILARGFKAYLKNILLPLDMPGQTTVNFAGSLANVFDVELKVQLEACNLKPGRFVENVADELAYFHSTHNNV